MARLNGDEIRSIAKELVLASPDGMRYSALVSALEAQHPETPHAQSWAIQRPRARLPQRDRQTHEGPLATMSRRLPVDHTVANRSRDAWPCGLDEVRTGRVDELGAGTSFKVARRSQSETASA